MLRASLTFSSKTFVWMFRSINRPLIAYVFNLSNLIWLTSLFSERFTEKILSSSAETSLQKACENSVFPSQCSYCLTYTIFMSWSKYLIINEMTVTFGDHHFWQLSLLTGVTFQDCYFVRTLFCWDLFLNYYLRLINGFFTCFQAKIAISLIFFFLKNFFLFCFLLFLNKNTRIIFCLHFN